MAKLQTSINDGLLKRFTNLAESQGLTKDELVKRLVAGYATNPRKFEVVYIEILEESKKTFALSLQK